MNLSAFLKRATTEVHREPTSGRDFPERRLLGEIVRRYLEDLKAYVENPERTERDLLRTEQSVDWVIEFWREHALHFLTVVLGHGNARSILRELEPLIRRAEEIHRERVRSGSVVVKKRQYTMTEKALAARKNKSKFKGVGK